MEKNKLALLGIFFRSIYGFELKGDRIGRLTERFEWVSRCVGLHQKLNDHQFYGNYGT